MATRETGLSRRVGDITRLDPWSEIQDMRRTMDDMFSRFFGYTPVNRLMGNALPSAWANWQPNVDLYETGEEFVFRADLPGYQLEDISIQITPDTLQINARHSEETAQESQAQLSQGVSDENAAPEPSQEGEQPQNTGAETARSWAVQSSQPHHPRTYHIQNRQRQSFSVSYTLPREIDPDRVEATYRSGVLEIHLPKPEQAQPKQVKVKVQG